MSWFRNIKSQRGEDARGANPRVLQDEFTTTVSTPNVAASHLARLLNDIIVGLRQSFRCVWRRPMSRNPHFVVVAPVQEVDVAVAVVFDRAGESPVLTDVFIATVCSGVHEALTGAQASERGHSLLSEFRPATASSAPSLPFAMLSLLDVVASVPACARAIVHANLPPLFVSSLKLLFVEAGRDFTERGSGTVNAGNDDDGVESGSSSGDGASESSSGAGAAVVCGVVGEAPDDEAVSLPPDQASHRQNLAVKLVSCICSIHPASLGQVLLSLVEHDTLGALFELANTDGGMFAQQIFTFLMSSTDLVPLTRAVEYMVRRGTVRALLAQLASSRVEHVACPLALLVRTHRAGMCAAGDIV